MRGPHHDEIVYEIQNLEGFTHDSDMGTLATAIMAGA